MMMMMMLMMMMTMLMLPMVDQVMMIFPSPVLILCSALCNVNSF